MCQAYHIGEQIVCDLDFGSDSRKKCKICDQLQVAGSLQIGHYNVMPYVQFDIKVRQFPPRGVFDLTLSCIQIFKD